MLSTDRPCFKAPSNSLYRKGRKADPGAMRIHIKQGEKSRSRSHEDPHKTRGKADPGVMKIHIKQEGKADLGAMKIHIKQEGKADPGAMRIHIKQGGKNRSGSHEEPKFHSISLRSLARRLNQSQVTSVSTRIQIKFMRIHGDPQGSTGIHEDPRGSMQSRGSVFPPCCIHRFRFYFDNEGQKSTSLFDHQQRYALAKNITLPSIYLLQFNIFHTDS